MTLKRKLPVETSNIPKTKSSLQIHLIMKWQNEISIWTTTSIILLTTSPEFVLLCAKKISMSYLHSTSEHVMTFHLAAKIKKDKNLKAVIPNSRGYHFFLGGTGTTNKIPAPWYSANNIMQVQAIWISQLGCKFKKQKKDKNMKTVIPIPRG